MLLPLSLRQVPRRDARGDGGDGGDGGGGGGDAVRLSSRPKIFRAPAARRVMPTPAARAAACMRRLPRVAMWRRHGLWIFHFVWVGERGRGVKT